MAFHKQTRATVMAMLLLLVFPLPATGEETGSEQIARIFKYVVKNGKVSERCGDATRWVQFRVGKRTYSVECQLGSEDVLKKIYIAIEEKTGIYYIRISDWNTYPDEVLYESIADKEKSEDDLPKIVGLQQTELLKQTFKDILRFYEG